MTIYNALRGRTRYPGLVNARLVSDYPGTVLSEPTLLHYFRMNETSGTSCSDSKGAITLSVNGGVSLGQTGRFSNGKSALFSGGYLLASAALASYSKLTIELWTKVLVTDTVKHAFYSDRGTGTVFMTGPNIIGGGAAHNLTFEQDAGGVAYGRGSTGQPINDAGWHHVVGVLNGTAGAINLTDFKLYLDGAEITTYSDDAYSGYNLPTTPAAFRVGDATAFGAAFIGYMCEYAIYSSALSAAAIAAHYLAASN